MSLVFGDALVDGMARRMTCLHGYGMADSCPGCAAAEEQRHTFTPVTFMGARNRMITRCRECGQGSLAVAHKPPRKARRAKNTTRQGANFELQVMADLEPHGYTSLRSSGSRGAVDVIAVASRDWWPATSDDCSNLLFIQCKIGNPLIPPDERLAVRDLAARAGALPVVAHRVDGTVHYRRLTGQGPKEWRYWFPRWCACGNAGCVPSGK